MNTLTPSLLLCGFLLLWMIAYFVFPNLLARLRQPRPIEQSDHAPFLAETGTIHRLGRNDPSENV